MLLNYFFMYTDIRWWIHVHNIKIRILRIPLISCTKTQTFCTKLSPHKPRMRKLWAYTEMLFERLRKNWMEIGWPFQCLWNEYSCFNGGRFGKKTYQKQKILDVHRLYDGKLCFKKSRSPSILKLFRCCRFAAIALVCNFLFGFLHSLSYYNVAEKPSIISISRTHDVLFATADRVFWKNNFSSWGFLVLLGLSGLRHSYAISKKDQDVLIFISDQKIRIEQNLSWSYK